MGAPDINRYLAGDSVYQQQLAALRRALGDYVAQNGQQANQYNTNFAASLNEAKLAERQGLSDQANDFASRGLYHSGIFANELGRLAGQYQRGQASMQRGRTDYLANLKTDLLNYRAENDLSVQKAKQDAIARRAAKYGLGA